MEILYKAKRLDNGEWVEGLPIRVVRTCLESVVTGDIATYEDDTDEDEIGCVWCICTDVVMAGESYDKPFIDELGGYDYDSDKKALYIVDPKTICIFTGLTDYYGTKIFENDIVMELDYDFDGKSGTYIEPKDEDERYIGVVKYGFYEWDAFSVYGFAIVPHKDVKYPHKLSIGHGHFKGRDDDVGELKVIGNIFDNEEPFEMMEGEDDE